MPSRRKRGGVSRGNNDASTSLAMSSRGKRSGVAIPSQESAVDNLSSSSLPGSKGSSVVRDETTGMESMDAFFDKAQSPNPTLEGDEKKDDDSSPSSPLRRSKRTPKKKRSPLDMDFSLPGQTNQLEEDDGSVARTKQSNLGSKIMGLSSPSELSKVSTLPPTPGTELLGHDDDDLPATQEEVEATRQAAADDAGREQPAPLDHSSADEADFPVTQDEGEEEEGDDLAPPILPEDDDVGVEEDSLQVSESLDDDDKEGTGFNMINDPETPQSVRDKRARKEEQELRARKKKRRKSVDTEDTTPPRKSKKKDKKRRVVFSPQGIPTGNRDYENIPLSHLVEPSPGDEGASGLRRSRRAKCKPLEFWKNEKLGYGPAEEDEWEDEWADAIGDMPVVKHVVKALPTPYRKRKPNANAAKKKSKSGKKGKRRSSRDSDDDDVIEEVFDTKELKRKFKSNLVEGESTIVWDDGKDESNELKVVSYADQMEAAELPVSSTRKKEEGNVVGSAAQAFNVPSDDQENYVGYIMGNLQLPPGGIKDAESVGPCSQTFTVCTGQKGALELAFSDPDGPEGVLEDDTAKRFLLGPGDLFRVPPGNTYRLQNHSRTKGCMLTWTIIRPRTIPQQG